MAHAAHVTHDDLHGLDVFSGLSTPALDWLLQVGTVRQLSRRERLAPKLEGPEAHYYFLLRGVMAIAIELNERKSLAASSRTKRPPKSERFLGYFEAGACFSDAFVDTQYDNRPSKLACVAANSVSILQLQQTQLGDLLAVQPEWRDHLAQAVARERKLFLSRQEPTRRVVQDFFLRENYVTSSVVRVGRLDRCLDCNKCYAACAARFGTPRMVRFGPSLGRLTFPIACRNCLDQPCIAACKFGGIALDAASGDVHILDTCTGCGVCARQCPNDAISMIPRPLVATDFPPLDSKPPTSFLDDVGVQGLPFGAPKLSQRPAAKTKWERAVKCDQCAGYSDRACLSACPTGALVEIETDQLFLEAEPDPLTRIRRFSDAPFLLGVPGRQASIKNWVTAFTLVILAGIGLECFLIRTQPESSLLGHYVEATASRITVSFTSGRGIGHWLGYVGASMMLASMLYTLRTRIGLFRRWGGLSGWFSAHIWLGFTGATLVTYHSALKLDRWAGIACMLMWLVIATGAVGRYVFGPVRSAVGLAEFEVSALRERCRAFAELFPLSGAVRALTNDDLSERENRWAFVAVLWEEFRDRTALLWLWAFETRRLQPGKERRAALGCFAQWAAHRRRIKYYQSLDMIVRHWNIVHIVLAIAMAILAGTHIVYGFRYKAV